MSGFVRAGDVRQLLRLVGECGEIVGAGGSPVAHFLSGLAGLTRSQIGIQMTACCPRLDAAPTIDEVVDVGWPSDSDRKRVYGFLSRSPIDSDPLSSAILRKRNPLTTMTRSDAVSWSAWRCTEARLDVHRPSGIDDSLLSAAFEGSEGGVRVLAFKRAWGEKPYDEEERELVHLAHGEWSWLLERRTAANGTDGVDLSPRERETLDLLLTGASEKSIAASLGLSPHTVHDYVKSIYRRMGVTSRAELMARAIAAPRSTRRP